MIADIFLVIADQWQIVFGLLLFIALCQILISLTLKNILGKQLTSNEYLSLGMAGWILPAVLISVLWFLFGFKPAAPFSLLLLMSLIGIPIFFLLRLKPQLEPDSKPTAFFLLLFFLVSVFLRLAFVSKAILPSYFDSAEHYRLIRGILENTSGILSSLTTNYYHLGFHFIAAFTASNLQAEIAKIMLILGQMILATLPLSLFFLIKHETRSNMAGAFAVVISAFGWYMPAHAMDWGKYPALMSLGLMPFILSLAYLLPENKNTLAPQKRRGLYLLLGAGILVVGLVHSRSLVILGIAFLSWVIAAWRQKLPQAQRTGIFVLVIIAIVLEAVYIQQQAVLTLVFDPYFPKGMLITALVLLLSVFAQKSYPRLTFTCILAICLFIGGLFIPVTGLIPGHDTLTLLDRPFVEMILFLPSALLGGLGLAGLGEYLQHKNIKAEFAGLITIALVLINAFFTYELYPLECCVLAGHDDVAAMDWLNDRLSADARIGVSAVELNVLASESFEGYVGGDAGIWIAPLTNRATVPLRYDTNFTEQSALDNICQLGISHLYVGGLGSTFDDSQLSAQPAWYKVLLSMPKVKVYQVVGCN